MHPLKYITTLICVLSMYAACTQVKIASDGSVQPTGNFPAMHGDFIDGVLLAKDTLDIPAYLLIADSSYTIFGGKLYQYNGVHWENIRLGQPAAGSNQTLQYNNNGEFAGVEIFKFDGSKLILGPSELSDDEILLKSPTTTLEGSWGGLYLNSLDGGGTFINTYDGGGTAINDRGNGGIYLNTHDGGPVGIDANGGGSINVSTDDGGVIDLQSLNLSDKVQMTIRPDQFSVSTNSPTSFYGKMEMYNDGYVGLQSRANDPYISIQAQDADEYKNTGISIEGNSVQVFSAAPENTFPGLTYNQDFSANYTDRSLVDKAYVDANSLTGTNGVHRSGSNIALGGSLARNTVIETGDHELFIGKDSSEWQSYLWVSPSQAGLGTNNPATGEYSYIDSGYGYLEFGASNGAGSESYLNLNHDQLQLNSADIFINNQYHLPTIDGDAGQVLTTDGDGNVGFSDIPSYSPTVSNGLSLSGVDNIQFGGSLAANTDLNLANRDLKFRNHSGLSYYNGSFLNLELNRSRIGYDHQSFDRSYYLDIDQNSIDLFGAVPINIEAVNQPVNITSNQKINIVGNLVPSGNSRSLGDASNYWNEAYLFQNLNTYNQSKQLAINDTLIQDYIGYFDFSGDYTDLTNKPTIPTNNNQLTNGAGYITGVTGSESAFTGWDKNAADDFSGDYTDLTNKPTIPTNNNQLTNGAGYITGVTGSETAFTGWDKNASDDFAVTNQADNRVLTSVSAGVGNAEEFLTFDGSTFTAPVVSTESVSTVAVLTEAARVTDLDANALVMTNGTKYLSSVANDIGYLYNDGAGALNFQQFYTTGTFTPTWSGCPACVSSSTGYYQLTGKLLTVFVRGYFASDIATQPNRTSTIQVYLGDVTKVGGSAQIPTAPFVSLKVGGTQYTGTAYMNSGGAVNDRVDFMWDYGSTGSASPTVTYDHFVSGADFSFSISFYCSDCTF